MTFFWSLENEKRAEIIRIESGKDDKVSHLSLEKEASRVFAYAGPNLILRWAALNNNNKKRDENPRPSLNKNPNEFLFLNLGLIGMQSLQIVLEGF